MAANLPNTDASIHSTFPRKLHSILTSERWSDIIKFEADGKKWKVLDKKRMEEEVLPLHFRHNKYLSFTRSAIGWGFKRVGKATYYHKLFNFNAPDLCVRMRRNSASNDNPIHRPVPDRSHRYGNLSGNNLINAYPNLEGQEGIPPLYLRLQNTHMVHPIQVRRDNTFPLRFPIPNEAVNTARGHNLQQGMLQTGMRVPVQYDEHFQRNTQHLGLNANSPGMYHNRQGVPIAPMLQDCMYREPSNHSQYHLPHDQIFDNNQTYTPGSVSHT
eukprot:CAMPEP_0194304110 /NCGR_PEP_ID=MMETSP0171-20130528/1904_1 /TAXON_ID=218684 /ORGANISM="Corethron pennatum, Strain L29A3" /LENGTH=270 /DNA_ID=CAMNT_0039055259 /DNA_START=42 /DNA_END=854 /DNA_ORIENTATION=+